MLSDDQGRAFIPFFFPFKKILSGIMLYKSITFGKFFLPLELSSIIFLSFIGL